MSDFDNWQDAFKKADANQYGTVAKALAGYRRALMAEGFTRRETMRLVESYSAFIYDMTLNEAEESGVWEVVDEGDDDTVDPLDETK